MKKKTITTNKATLLVVEMPEGAKPHNSYCDAILYTLPTGYVETEYPVESDGSWEWQLLGRLPDITEEQSDKLVERHYMDGCRSYDIYRDYRLNSEDGRWIDNSLESLSSLLQANEVYFEYDPYDCSNYFCEGGKIDVGYGDFMTCSYCEEAQSKVWDKERCYLFIKVD